MSKKSSKNSLNCSFCGKRHDDVIKLIEGNSANICNECVELYYDLVKEETESKDSEIITDKHTLLTAVSEHGFFLSTGSDELKNDIEVVMAAVTSSGTALEYASDELKNNEEVVTVAIENSIGAFEYAGKDILNNYDMVLKAVKIDGSAIQYISQKLLNDRSIVLAAVTSNSSALEYVSDEFKDDRELVLEAMRNSGGHVGYINSGEPVFSVISKRLQLDEEVVKLAVESCPAAIANVNKKYKNNKQLVLSAVKADGSLLEYASNTLKSDIDVITAAAFSDQSVLKYASDSIRSNEELILNLIINNKIYLQHASSNLRENNTLIQHAKLNILERLKERGDLIDVYSNEWLSEQKDESPLNLTIASKFDKKFGDAYKGHLKVICISSTYTDDVSELTTVYPQLQQQINNDAHRPNFLFINENLNKILCVGLGRKNSIFILDSDTNKSVDVFGVPGNPLSNKKYILEFTKMDYANVVKTIVHTLNDASMLMMDQAFFDEYESEEYEDVCDRLYEVFKGIQVYFPQCESGDLKTGD